MSDAELRRLEREARNGDPSAAESLYWKTIQVRTGPQLFDRLIEAVLTQSLNGGAPDVWQKLAFLRGEPILRVPPEQLEERRRAYRSIPSSSDLHRIPRDVRQAGFTTYCRTERAVMRLGADGQWRQVARLSEEPPGFPFHVVQTLADRDALEVPVGSSCLVLVNRGIYLLRGRRPPPGASWADSTTHRAPQWSSIRFETGNTQ